jgi:nitrogen fixation protein FixH
MVAQLSTASASGGRLANCRWAPWAIVGAFLVVFAVNGGLVYFALASWSGLTTDHAYDEGLTYNRVIEETRREAQLGWTLSVGFIADAKAKERGQLVVDAHDRAGKPLEKLVIKAEIVRPVGEEADIPLVLERTEGGRYVAPLELPLPGQWDIYVTAKDGETLFHTGRRIVVR